MKSAFFDDLLPYYIRRLHEIVNFYFLSIIMLYRKVCIIGVSKASTSISPKPPVLR